MHKPGFCVYKYNTDEGAYFICADVTWSDPVVPIDVSIKKVEMMIFGMLLDVTEAAVKHPKIAHNLENKVRKEFKRRYKLEVPVGAQEGQ